MSDTPVSPRSHRLKTAYPGLVWAVPIAALLIVLYLGIDALANRGEVVTVTFQHAADARPKDTKVLYEGVEAGELIKILPNEDGRRIDFQLRLIPQAKPGLNSNARFWLIGASPTLSDLSSLKAVVSGVAIGYAPGEGGTPTTHFDGLQQAPTVLPGDKGTHYTLTARTLGSVADGTILLFHGQAVGKITAVEFKGEAGFRLDAFVFKPYDSLIRPGTRFWRSSPLRLSLAGGGVNASLAPTSTLLAGGIDLELPAAGDGGTQSPEAAEFKLYATRSAAREGLTGPTLAYEFAFSGASGALDEEAPVTLLGFQIGEVSTTRLAFDAAGKPYTVATALLYPRQLQVNVPMDATAGMWQATTDAKLRQLLRAGYRARLQQTPALIGTQAIALVEVKGAMAADLTDSGPHPRIPSAPGGSDLDDITAQTGQILAKINQIPIEQIGQDLRQVTARLRTLVSSPAVDQSLAHLNGTLSQVDQLLNQLQPQITPLMAKLNEAASEVAGTALAAHQLLETGGGAQGDSLPETIRQLTEAARSIRTLADYLDRHPESLIRGKRPEK